MKEAELRTLTECAVCRRKLGETPLPIFWKVNLERHVLNIQAVSRQTGLALMLGGNGILAATMGPDEEMTELVNQSTCMVCDDCAIKNPVRVFELSHEN